MYGLIYFFVILVGIIIFFSFLTLEIGVNVRIQNKKNNAVLVLRLLRGLIHLKFNFTFIAPEKGILYIIISKANSELEHRLNVEEIFYLFRQKRTKYTRFSGYFRDLLLKIIITNINIDLKLGLQDAAHTALVFGSIMTVLMSPKGYLPNKFNIKNTKIKLTPYFNEAKLDLALDCIIKLKLGHIIITAIRMLLHSIKGGDISGRASY